MKPLISIIIPAYNVEKYIDRCIRSLIDQSYKDLEIIIIDDGSDDGTFRICQSFEEKDSRIKLIHNSNCGVSFSRNEGMKMAKGDFVSFLDADDWLDTNLFQFLIEQSYVTCADIFTFDSEFVYEDDFEHRVKQNFWKKFKDGQIFKGKDLFRKIFNTSAWITNKLFKRSLLNGTYFDEKMTYAEDVYFLCEILKKECTVATYNYSGYYRQMRADSASRTESYNKNIEYITNNFLIYNKLTSLKCGDVGINRVSSSLASCLRKAGIEDADSLIDNARIMLRKTSLKDRIKFYFCGTYGNYQKLYLFFLMLSKRLWKKLFYR